jgi:hypothetical protein
VCPSSAGGLLDSPGLVTGAVGNVLDKWEKVRNQIRDTMSSFHAFLSASVTVVGKCREGQNQTILNIAVFEYSHRAI